MNSFWRLYIGFILILSGSIQNLFAQQEAHGLIPLTISKTENKAIPGFCEPFKKSGNFYYEASEIRNVFTPFLYTNFIPEGAVFCRMENMVLEKYNFHIRIHAGDIDMYRRMIDERKDPVR
jgi:hypothetical protein